MNRKQILIRFAILAVIGYATIVSLIFMHRHLKVPRGMYAKNLTGTYQAVDSISKQIPEVLRGKRISIIDNGHGRIVMVDDRAKRLSLQHGVDGMYFSQNFSPVGARIAPGIVRNWNEGRITQTDDGIVVEGYMLEKGLMLFVFPFKDVSEWHLELKHLPEEEGLD